MTSPFSLFALHFIILVTSIQFDFYRPRIHLTQKYICLYFIQNTLSGYVHFSIQNRCLLWTKPHRADSEVSPRYVLISDDRYYMLFSLWGTVRAMEISSPYEYYIFRLWGYYFCDCEMPVTGWRFTDQRTPNLTLRCSSHTLRCLFKRYMH